MFGAQAVVAYGFPRLSADVDVTLALTPDDPERFSREIESAGFSLRVADPAFVRQTHASLRHRWIVIVGEFASVPD